MAPRIKSYSTSCPFCDRVVDSMYRHLLSFHTFERPVWCKKCDYCTTSKNHLDRHEAYKHSGAKQFKCEQCPMTFKTAVNRRAHQSRVHVKTTDNCTICQRAFNSKADLNRHTVSHTGEKPFKCDICGKQLMSGYSLTLHKRLHSANIEVAQKYKCDVCDRRFHSQTNFTNHKLTHSDVKSHPCKICNKSFKLKPMLNAHMVIHTGETPFGCDLCGKFFSRRSSRDVHKRLHDRATLKCDTCGEPCFNEISLKRHKSKFHGENMNKHSCPFCEKKFSFSGLTSHLSRHINERYLWCKKCQQEFTDEKPFKNHQRVCIKK